MTCNSIPNAARPRPGDGNACGGEARAIRFVLILACVLTQAGCDADRCLRHSDCPASFMCQEGLCQLRPVEGDAGPAGGGDGGTPGDSAMPSALDASTGPSARSDGSMRDAAAPAAADAGGDASSAPSSDGGAGDAQDGAPG